jgi:hypothetical protein
VAVLCLPNRELQAAFDWWLLKINPSVLADMKAQLCVSGYLRTQLGCCKKSNFVCLLPFSFAPPRAAGVMKCKGESKFQSASHWLLCHALLLNHSFCFPILLYTAGVATLLNASAARADDAVSPLRYGGSSESGCLAGLRIRQQDFEGSGPSAAHSIIDLITLHTKPGGQEVAQNPLRYLHISVRTEKLDCSPGNYLSLALAGSSEKSSFCPSSPAGLLLLCSGRAQSGSR